MWSVGGRNYDDARNFGGYLAEVGMWSRVLSADERAALAAGYSPLFFPIGLRHYAPLIRDPVDRVTGAAGTLDGTAVVDHPRIIYPAGVQHIFAATAAGGVPIGAIADHYYRTRRVV